MGFVWTGVVWCGVVWCGVEVVACFQLYHPWFVVCVTIAQSKEAERVVQTNKQLMKENADLRREIEVRSVDVLRPLCTLFFGCA